MNLEDKSIEWLKGHIEQLKYERANLKPERSGQASNYYAPAIFYAEEALKKKTSQHKETNSDN